MSENHYSPFPETLDLKQAAQFLHLGYDSMKELVETGAVPAVCLNQKHTVILREELIAFVRDEGRRQAEKRSRPAKAIPTRAVRAAPPKRTARALPDLGQYDGGATTSAQQGSTRVN